MTQSEHLRRHDIDWLRVLAFLILIFYHIGMYYVENWGWHIKSDDTFRWLQEVMILTNTWRMSLLFLISAMALALVQQKYKALELAKLRSDRLMIPLLFGMFVIVTPQVYIEAISQNLISPGYFAFWADYINPNTDLLVDHHSSIGLLTWNHLWFIPYVWLYSLIILLIKPLLNMLVNSDYCQKLHFMVAFGLGVALLSVSWLTLRKEFPVTHGLTDDWYSHSKYFLVFIFGYFLALHKVWWQWVIDHRRLFLTMAILSYVFLVLDRNDGFTWMAQQYTHSLLIKIVYSIIYTGNHWVWIIAVVGYAGRYLTFSTPTLEYANKAVLPWYIFHQTLIVVFAWNLSKFSLPTLVEFLLITGFTMAGCWLGYEIVRRTRFTRWLFGLK